MWSIPREMRCSSSCLFQFKMNPQSQRVMSDRGRVRHRCYSGWGILLAAFLAASGLLAGAPCAAHAKHAIAMHGEPALSPGFAAFPYVDPDAPKGGQLTKGILGSFDSLNPFNGKGLPVPELQIRGPVIESLMTRGYDEPFTLYGLLANSVPRRRSQTACRLLPMTSFFHGSCCAITATQ